MFPTIEDEALNLEIKKITCEDVFSKKATADDPAWG
jgi:hypothetical protein